MPRRHAALTYPAPRDPRSRPLRSTRRARGPHGRGGASRGALPALAVLAVIAVIATWTLLGCAARKTGPLEDPVTPPPAFSATGTELLAERWWTTFDDPALNETVEAGLESNFDLKAAWERLRAARAIVDRTSADFLPELEGTVTGRYDVTDAPLRDDGGDIELGLAATYEADLWGRIRSATDAERLRAEATRAEYHAAAVSLSAEIVRTWYRLAEAHEQVALVREQEETNASILELLENRFGTGLVRGVDILRQRQLLESTREERTLAEGRVGVLEHQLAVLLGRPPQDDLAAVPERLPQLPPLPATGIPAELVERRPDVRQTFHLLHAADRDLATAISNKSPRLTLSASTGVAADGAGTLFREWALAAVGELLAPIFLGGELRAEVSRTEAVRRQRLQEHGQAILTALRDVEDALVLEAKQREGLVHLEKQVELGRRTQEQLRTEFLHGTSDYLDALTALDELQERRRELLAARRTLVEHRIALHRALAGPISTSLDAPTLPSAPATIARDDAAEGARGEAQASVVESVPASARTSEPADEARPTTVPGA